MLKLCAVLVACVPICGATGAFSSLWLLDLRRAARCWPGYELFTSEHADYGRNDFAMIASHPSQYWFTVHGVYVENPDAIDDVSDIYVARRCGRRTLQFIGYATFILIMAKLLPMFAEGLVPWHEAIIQSNDYPGELGCRVTVRSHQEPMVWWLRVGAELSISAGKEMFQNFMSIKLPRLLIGNDWNYASWHPYFQLAGPRYFCYTPHKTLEFVGTMVNMAEEENYMAKTDPIHAIEPKTMKRIVKAYAPVYTEGRWLTKADKMKLSRTRKAMY